MDLEKFKTEILPLRDKLFRLGLRIIRDVAEAEDLVQEVMLKMWDRRKEWEKIENKEAYCCTMIRNLALNKMALKVNRCKGIDDGIQVWDGGITPDEELEHEDDLRLLRELIGHLPEKQRTLVQLRDIEGMSYQEIVVILGISEEQVKVNLFRARKEIKELFLKIDGYGLQKN